MTARCNEQWGLPIEYLVWLADEAGVGSLQVPQLNLVTGVEGNLLSVRNNPTRRNQEAKTTLKVVTNEKGEAVGDVLTIIC